MKTFDSIPDRGAGGENIQAFFSREDIGMPEDELTGELKAANLKIKLQLFRAQLERAQGDTPGPNAGEWIRKFDELFGPL